MTKKKSRIPKFKSIQEEAEFWDTHDTTDYEDEMQPVKVKFDFSRPVTVRFDQGTLEALETQAQQKGIGPSTLIRMWVLEQLRRSRQKTTLEAA